MARRSNRRSFLQYTASAAGLASALATAGLSVWAGGEKRPLRLAICNETFGDWPFQRACDFAAQCGYTGIEIAPFTLAQYVTDISAGRRAEIRKQAERANLEVVALHWLLTKTEGLHLTSPDRQIRRKTAEYFSALAQFCADLGGKILVLGSPKQRSLLSGVSLREGMQYAAETLRAALPALEKAGVVIGIEPLSPDVTNFVNTAADGEELIELVGSPHVRLHLDCLAMSHEPTPIPDLIRKHRARLVHFHANDPNGLGPGFGTLDFRPIFQALREIGYRGWVSVEVFDYKPGGARLARESMHYMRQCLDTGNPR